MLNHLVAFSLRYRMVVMLLAAMAMVGGYVAMRRSPWDVFPEFAPPQIVVHTVAAGLSTEQVEQLVTVPVEAALSGVNRLRILRSSSAPGLSVVTVIFEDGTNILDARQLVNERLGEVTAYLPRGVETPRMMPLAASTSRFLMIGLKSDKTSPMELRTLADWTLRRRLQAVPGVAHVEIFGGEVKQYQVLVRPDQLQQYHLGVADVLAAARRSTAFGGAGFIETANQRLPIQQRARIESPDDLAATPVVFERGANITLGQVADVRIGAADKYGDSTIDGDPGVLLVLHKQPFHNTLAVTDDVNRVLDSMRSTLPADVTLQTTLFRQAAFIERAIANLSFAIVLGSVLVALVLVAFLRQWRTVIISLTAIPLSLLGAILILRAFGASLNAMTLGGLAIAVGEVVDDAIVDVENVVRRLRENRSLTEPRPAFRVVLDASLEVRSSVVYATFIVILVFLPIFFMEGLAGSFFRPLGLAYVASTLCSLLVALTVTPAMSLWLLPRANLDEQREPRFARALKGAYSRLLPACLRKPRLTLVAAGMSVIVALGLAPFLGGEFLPDFRESNFVIFMAGKPDSSLAETVRAGNLVTRQLQAIPGVKSVAHQIGRANLSEDTWGPNISEVWVVLEDDADHLAIWQQVRDDLEQIPGFIFQTKQFLRERIDEVLTGATADVAIRVIGPDLGVLRAKAGEIAEAAEGIPGAVDLRVEPLVDVPQVEMLLRPHQAAQYGLSVGELNDSIQTLLAGTVTGQVYDGDAVFDVVVRAAPEVRGSPTALGALLVDSPSQGKVPLHAVANIALAASPNIINRESASRQILVTCNVSGRDAGSVVRDWQARIAEKVSLPATGYHLEYGGEYQARNEAAWRLLLWSAASLVGIWILLFLDFRSVPLTLLIMLSVPLACVGGVVAVVLSGGDLSLGSMVGFVTVFGIAVRNGILIVSHYEHLRNEEGQPSDASLLVRGASDRLSPILMTTATTVLGLMPLVVQGNLPGNEIEHPMAVVIFGGLLSSAFLTLFVLPVLYGVVQRNGSGLIFVRATGTKR
jgi:CzcA family heavy metal efflux pump